MPRVLVLALAAGCTDSKSRIEERQKAIEAARAAAKAKQQPQEAPKAEPVRLDAFWDDASYVKVVPDGQCPEGIWALFSGDAPGDTPDEKKANAARRAELAKKLRESTFLVKLRAPTTVKLHEYDAPKGQFPIEIAGSVDCTDSFGHLTFAWTPAKAITPGLSAAKQGAEVAQNIWVAEPMTFHLPMRSQSEAREFKEKRRLDLHARIVMKLGKTEVDRKMFRTTKQTSGDISIGGGVEDWGAGRLVRAELLGLRLATEHEKMPLIENKGK